MWDSSFGQHVASLMTSYFSAKCRCFTKYFSSSDELQKVRHACYAISSWFIKAITLQTLNDIQVLCANGSQYNMKRKNFNQGYLCASGEALQGYLKHFSKEEQYM